MHIFCQKSAVLVYPGCQIKFYRMTGSCITEGLFPADVQLDWSATDLCCQKSIQWLIKYILFIAESSPDIWLNNPHIAPRNSQCLANDTTDDVWNLCRCHHYDPAFFHIGIRNRIFNMTVLHDWCFICALYNCFSLLHPLIYISDKIIRTGKDIIFFIKMNRRITAIHRFAWMDFHRIFLIFYFDQLQCPGCNDLIFCNNSRNIISIIPHTTSQKITVCHILMCQFHRPRMPWCRITVVWHIIKSHYFYNPFQCLCLTCIDRFHNSISNRCMKNFCHETSGRYQIICEFGSSGHFFIGINSGNAFSYHDLTFFIEFCQLESCHFVFVNIPRRS